MEQKDVLKALQRDHAAELKKAAERLKGTARHTEIIPSPALSEMTGHEILLKPENLQVTGSFKIRGAYNKIASLSEEQLARGIVTASAGNHAQGVAYAARERHAKATICMPQITPPLKVDATKAYGADVVLYGDVFDEAAAYAAKLSKEQGMIYVPPFDDYEVLCGQGTIGMEILEDVPNVTDVVVPLGGGGLGAGVALAIALESIFPPIPSEVILPLAGFTAARGTLSLVEAVVWATVGSLLGAWALYGISRWVGLHRINLAADKIPGVSRKDVGKANAWFTKYGTWSVLIGRVIPVVRSLISIPAGFNRMSFLQFSGWTLLGSAIWNTILVSAGYLLGDQWDDFEQAGGQAGDVMLMLASLQNELTDTLPDGTPTRR